jgi:hypothetical protein
MPIAWVWLEQIEEAVVQATGMAVGEEKWEYFIF